MSNPGFVTLTRSGAPRQFIRKGGPVLLLKPPYFSPLTPPLGIAIIKSFVERHGFTASCFDFNTDPELWGIHHKYFGTLQALEDVSINDGYSKLWWILNAHLLARANGAGPERCARVLEAVIPLYGISCNRQLINSLTSLVEKFFSRLEELTNQLELADDSVVGTSTYTTSLGPSLFILKKLKQKHPRIKTVMGGGAFADDLALGSDNLDTLIREYDYVDHVTLGEGELLFLKLLQGELAHKRVISIADLHGTTLEMRDVPVPDFSDVNHKNYYHLSIEGARSCPFQCSFCSETIQWGDYRKKPMNLFAEQVIELAGRYENNSFFMGDSLMNPYINQFATELVKRKAGILYDGYLRADKPVTHDEFVKLWASSGCYRVRLGIESAATRVLDAMDKMTTPKVISDVLKTLAQAGIRTTTYWIVGFPGETEEDFQETCDFIREHSRYIYELEAHPYYYYPYGQVGSRLYQCYSLYPEAVTDTIKFNVWDIVNSVPTRMERYDRLRRISSLASDLGLPNIYTMAERYQAEDRWHSLHPLATEVYEGTLKRRPRFKVSQTEIKPFSKRLKRDPEHAVIKTEPVIAYQVSVNKPIDEKILSAALAELIEHNEVLQMSCDTGIYVISGLPHSFDNLLSVYDVEGKDEGEADVLVPRLVEEISKEMRPEPGASVRAALVKRGEAWSDLVLLVHQHIADGKSVVLFLEDLYRIYEQLANQKRVSLIPLQKTFTEFMSERASSVTDRQVEGQVENIEVAEIFLDEFPDSSTLDDLSGQSDLSLNEVFIGGVLNCLYRIARKEDLAVDVTQNPANINRN